MNRVVIIDYGMGNLHSVASALHQVAPQAQISITQDANEIAQADRIIFPGVGAIRDCMGEIRRLGFDSLLPQQLQTGKPVLAICVGMQALMAHSEENNGVSCLGLLPGQVNNFSQSVEFIAANAHTTPSTRLKVPHMGWNRVKQTQNHPLWQGISQDSRFYFVHSFYVTTPQPDLVAGECHHGLTFAAALAQDNLFAVQFHPEKSHTAGLQLLSNFITWNGHP